MPATNSLRSHALRLLVGGVVLVCGCGGGDDGGAGTLTYAVDVAVSGLDGSGLVLRNNNSDDLQVPESGVFTFATKLRNGDAYEVSVHAQPANPTQICVVSNGSGTVERSRITNVLVTCTNAFTVSGVVSGLEGSGLVLNTGYWDYDPIEIETNGPFTMPSPIATGEPYGVVVSTQPSNPDQTCVVTHGSGTMGTSNVTDVLVECFSGVDSVVHAFQGGVEGTFPYDGVIGDSAGNLYGTTRYGGDLVCSSHGCGTVFMVDADGNLLTLHAFAGSPTDGTAPSGLLARDAAGNLYGTTQGGGTGGSGTIYKLDIAGNEEVLHHFAGGDGGAVPKGVLRDLDGNLYGVTINGGLASPNRPNGCGTVFRLEPDGTFTTLHRFAADGSEGCGANGLETAGTQSGLIRDATGNLYGTRYNGGAGDGEHGTVFRLDAAGVFTTLHDFASNPEDLASHLVPRHPGGPLMRDDAGNLYGVTEYGGRGVAENSFDDSGGIIFRLDPEGEISILHEFALEDRYDGWPYSTEPGGTAPSAGLVGDAASNVYGTTLSGGDDARGIVYRFDMQSHALEVIHTFTIAEGGRVAAPLVHSAGVLYGTTARGGDLACNPPIGCGTVFRID